MHQWLSANAPRPDLNFSFDEHDSLFFSPASATLSPWRQRTDDVRYGIPAPSELVVGILCGSLGRRRSGTDARALAVSSTRRRAASQEFTQIWVVALRWWEGVAQACRREVLTIRGGFCLVWLLC